MNCKTRLRRKLLSLFNTVRSTFSAFSFSIIATFVFFFSFSVPFHYFLFPSSFPDFVLCYPLVSLFSLSFPFRFNFPFSFCQNLSLPFRFVFSPTAGLSVSLLFSPCPFPSALFRPVYRASRSRPHPHPSSPSPLLSLPLISPHCYSLYHFLSLLRSHVTVFRLWTARSSLLPTPQTPLPTLLSVPSPLLVLFSGISLNRVLFIFLDKMSLLSR